MLSRRSRPSVIWASVFFVLIWAAPVCSQDKDQSNQFTGMIHFYQEYISPVDGNRCPMYPSCSGYINNSVKKHGLLTGWIMGFDRLVRCGRDEVKNASSIWMDGRKYTYDPVENNDFWWSEK